MKNIKILIKISKDTEIERVLWTKNRLKWYTENKYDVNKLILPKGIGIEAFSMASESDLIKLVENDYNHDLFKSHIETIETILPKYLEKLLVYFKQREIPVLSELEINLTRYGMGGSYNVPNTVIVNITNFFGIGLIRNILHEVIHLHIQYLINEYKVSQWEKEVMVNNIFEKIFPDLFKKPNYPIDMTEVQKIFDAHYPDIKLIAESISGLGLIIN